MTKAELQKENVVLKSIIVDLRRCLDEERSKLNEVYEQHTNDILRGIERSEKLEIINQELCSQLKTHIELLEQKADRLEGSIEYMTDDQLEEREAWNKLIETYRLFQDQDKKRASAAKQKKTEELWSPYIKKYDDYIAKGKAESWAINQIGNIIENDGVWRKRSKQDPEVTITRPDRATLRRQLVTNRK